MPPANQRSVSLNAPYHKVHEYVWFRGWDLNKFWEIAFYEVKGMGHAPGLPKVCVVEYVL